MEIQAKARIAITITFGLLLLASLACNQAGEILTPAEATARAAPSPTPTRPVEESESEGEAAPAGLEVGDTVQLVGKLYLVSLMDGPGSTHMIAGQERGVDVVIIGAAEHEGESWYEIDAPTGEGWVPAENLQVPEGAADSEGAPAGPQAGDTVYLAGKLYLVSLMDGPGSTHMIAGQERGVEVTIVEVGEVDGETWYQIDAPTGRGWVKAENISTEAP